MQRQALSLGAAVLFAAVSIVSLATPDTQPQAAQAVLDAALKKGKAAHKPVFVLFHASW